MFLASHTFRLYSCHQAAVQKWPTSSINNINVEKSKHVYFDVEGGLSLHFNVGSKDNSEAIVAKLESSKALALQSETTSPTTSRAPPPPSLDTLPSKAPKASVHFAPESPAIIPSRDSIEPEEEEPHVEEEEEGEGEGEGEMAVALYPFSADGDDELSVAEGEQLMILEKDGDEWWKCRNADGAEGVVPASYIELTSSGGQVPTVSASVPQEEEEPEEQEQEDLAAQEEEAAAAAAERARKEQAAATERERRKKAATERARKEQAAAAERERKEEAAAAERARREEQERKEKEGEAERAKRKQKANVSHPSPPPSTTR